MKPKILPSAELLRSLFVYEPETGRLLWRVSFPTVEICAGDEAGSIATGYRVVKIDGCRYPAHRVIWKIVTGNDPDNEIDHVDGDKINNKLINLREASRAENARNIKLIASNTSGLKGVSFHRQRKRWYAQIRLNGRCVSLGLFGTREAAHEAYKSASEKHFGEFSRTT